MASGADTYFTAFTRCLRGKTSGEGQLDTQQEPLFLIVRVVISFLQHILVVDAVTDAFVVDERFTLIPGFHGSTVPNGFGVGIFHSV